MKTVNEHGVIRAGKFCNLCLSMLAGIEAVLEVLRRNFISNILTSFQVPISEELITIFGRNGLKAKATDRELHNYQATLKKQKIVPVASPQRPSDPVACSQALGSAQGPLL
jgi:hypothetical protein